MTLLVGIALIIAAALVGIAGAYALICFERHIRLEAPHHYRDCRRHTRWMKQSRERGARLRIYPR